MRLFVLHEEWDFLEQPHVRLAFEPVVEALHASAAPPRPASGFAVAQVVDARKAECARIALLMDSLLHLTMIGAMAARNASTRLILT